MPWGNASVFHVWSSYLLLFQKVPRGSISATDAISTFTFTSKKEHFKDLLFLLCNSEQKFCMFFLHLETWTCAHAFAQKSIFCKIIFCARTVLFCTKYRILSCNVQGFNAKVKNWKTLCKILPFMLLLLLMEKGTGLFVPMKEETKLLAIHNLSKRGSYVKTPILVEDEHNSEHLLHLYCQAQYV